MVVYIRIWKRPAFVTYFTPLNGLYFSPYISKRFTLSPDTASCEMLNWTLIDGFVSRFELPTATVTVPRMFGNLALSIRPTSQWSIFWTVSNVYLPWFTTNRQLATDLGMQISNFTPSMVLPRVVFGPTVMSSLPCCSPDLNVKLCLT